MENQQVIVTSKRIKTPSAISRINFLFVTLFYCQYDICIAKSVVDMCSIRYIVPCYDVLHTFSKDYIMDDLIGMLKKKGALS